MSMDNFRCFCTQRMSRQIAHGCAFSLTVYAPISREPPRSLSMFFFFAPSATSREIHDGWIAVAPRREMGLCRIRGKAWQCKLIRRTDIFNSRASVRAGRWKKKIAFASDCNRTCACTNIIGPMARNPGRRYHPAAIPTKRYLIPANIDGNFAALLRIRRADLNITVAHASR